MRNEWLTMVYERVILVERWVTVKKFLKGSVARKINRKLWDQVEFTAH